MGGILASCACSCFGTCCASICGAADGAGASKNTRGPYLVLMFLSTALALILRYWGEPLVVHLYIFHWEACGDRCMGIYAVYRISFALFVFFALHWMLLQSEACAKAHYKGWGTKFIGFILFLVFTMAVIHNSFFDVYSYIARFVSALFLLVQLMFLVDFAYKWHENWISDEKDWKIPLLVASLLMYIGSLVVCIFCFKWFAESDTSSCGTQKFILSMTIILTLLATGLSVSPQSTHGILPAAVVTLYAWYLAYSALSSSPDGACNHVNGNSTASLVIGIVIAAISMTYAAWSISEAGAVWGEDEDGATERHTPLPDSSADPETAEKAVDSDNEEDAAEMESQRGLNSKFHLIMAIAAMYLAMVLTNWGYNQGSSGKAYDLSSETLWIKAVSQWVVLLLYIWTLIAPMVLTNRDFD